MTQVLCFLAPSFICVSVFEKIQKKQFGWKKFLVKCMIFIGIINMLCFGVITIFFQKPNRIINSELFSISFMLKYLLLSLAIAVMIPYLYVFYLKYDCIRENDVVFENKKKIILSVIVSFFFSFTIIVFTPYDIFFGNHSDFVFGFSDFWWIMASFGLIVFAVLTVIFMILPAKVFAVSVSMAFSLTLCAYIQRMFLNLYITSMVGENLSINEHPIWAIINLLIWCGIVLGLIILMNMRKNFWEKLIFFFTTGLVFIQAVALGSLLITEDLRYEQGKCLTTDNLYKLGSTNNIIVFVLDHYDYSFLEAVQETDPTFYDILAGFTLFDNTTAVYSRTYPANTYLLTGKELEEYHTKSYKECIEKAYIESNFLTDLNKLNFNVGIYTDSRYLGDKGKKLADNYLPKKIKLGYKKTVCEMLRCSFYFEMPYILKPYFWFYNEFNTALEQSNLYIIDDAEFYQSIQNNELSIGDYECGYKYIHMTGAHSPYTLNENGERIKEEVTGIAQWKGCMNIVKEYLNQIEKLGLYDSSTIIITADHGTMSGSGDLNDAVSPILFVKPVNADRALIKISHAPVSHADIFPTIIEAAGGDFGEYGRPIFSIQEGEKRNRIFHYSAMTDWQEREIIDYEISGDVRDFSCWTKRRTKKVEESMYRVLE